MRIVSLAPVITEIIYELGLGEQVVAVTRFCDWPPTVKAKEKIGAWINTEPEKINEFQPDIIIGSYFMPESMKQWSGAGKQMIFEPKNLWDVFESIRSIGGAIGADKQADAVVDNMKKEFDQLRASHDGKLARVYMEEWFDPPLAAGNWVPEIVAIAGGSEVIAEIGKSSIEFSLAALEIADPDLIVCHWSGWGTRVDSDRIFNRSGWNGLRAIAENKVFFVDDALINRPGPRLIQGAQKLNEIFTTTLDSVNRVN